MSMGPVEVLIVSFPGNKFTGDVAPALAELVEKRMIRVIDLVFITKDADGNVAGVELAELDEATAAAYRRTSRIPAGWCPRTTWPSWGLSWHRTRRPRSCSSSTYGPRSSVTRASPPAASWSASIRIPQDVIEEVLAAS